MPSVVAVDVDRTLVSSSTDEELHPITRQAIDRLRADGVPVVPATGRPVTSAMRAGALVGAPYVVALGGAVVLDADGGVVWTAPAIRPDLVKAIWTQQYLVMDTRIHAHTADGSWHVSHDDEETRSYGERHDMPPYAVGLPVGDVLMLELVAGGIPPMTGVTAVTARSDNRDYVDVTAPGVDKAAGVTHLLSLMGLDWRDLWAAGDGRNDVALLRQAARGIVVGSEPPADLLAVASHHVALTPEAGALGVALLALAYGEPAHVGHVRDLS